MAEVRPGVALALAHGVGGLAALAGVDAVRDSWAELVVLGLLAVAAVVTALRRRARAFRGTRYPGVATAVSSDT